MTTYRIMCYNENQEYQEFIVPREVYLYIRQLECHANYPDISKLNELYPVKFSAESDHNS